MSLISSRKTAAYMATDYRVRDDAHAFSLRIGQPSPGLEKLYASTGKTCALFITASNPYGEIQSDDDNQSTNNQLGVLLRSLSDHVFAGYGTDGTGDWPSEQSYLALGIAESIAIRLGIEARQDAVVWAGQEAVPRLLMLR